jgi:hypothetical protein
MAVQKFGLRLVGAASILETFTPQVSKGVQKVQNAFMRCIHYLSGARQSQFGHDFSQIMPVAVTKNHIPIRSADETRLLPTNCG